MNLPGRVRCRKLGSFMNPFGKVRLGFELVWTGGMWEVRFFYEPFWEGEIGI